MMFVGGSLAHGSYVLAIYLDILVYPGYRVPCTGIHTITGTKYPIVDLLPANRRLNCSTVIRTFVLATETARKLEGQLYVFLLHLY